MGLLDFENEVNEMERDLRPAEILRPPFPYPGGKSKIVNEICDCLPYAKGYIEVFGGSGAVLLARHASRFEVFNDRHAGVVAFYKCMRDPQKLEALMYKIEMSLHSKEDWYDSKSWKLVEDDVERAYRWYYCVAYSFASLGRNWGRGVKIANCMSGKIRDKLPFFGKIHERFQKVQIENLDWRDMLKDYDHYDHVMYLDPPYLETCQGTYTHNMTENDHAELLQKVFKLQAYVAVSGYHNPLYDAQPWDEVREFNHICSLEPKVGNEGNGKTDTFRDKNTGTIEVVYIKHARYIK